ncbi:hypothetical protein [Sphingomonas sp. Leaf38]|uniref:hypothetical protein n=1 Tax=Sphingomonas sp. Leaf38 TaxID=1736217 RepID=UPI0012E0F4E8|nr:hypothetical protein [Sphingomonas sp. Leaf38]
MAFTAATATFKRVKAENFAATPKIDALRKALTASQETYRREVARRLPNGNDCAKAARIRGDACGNRQVGCRRSPRAVIRVAMRSQA